MPEIPFIQFMRPNGRQVDALIDRPQEIYDKAMKILEAGYGFTCEQLMNGMISLTISENDGEGEDAAIELCKNTKAVPIAVDKLVTEFILSL